MTLTIELNPEKEEALRTEAARQGVSVEEHAKSLLEGTLPNGLKGAAISADTGDEDFEAALAAFSEGSERLPVLPPQANSRQWIYPDRD